MGTVAGSNGQGTADVVHHPGGFIEYMKQRINYLQSQPLSESNRPLTSSSNLTDTSHVENDAQEQSSRQSIEIGSTQTLMEDAAADVGYLSLTAMGGSRNRESRTRDNMSTAFIKDIIALNGKNPSLAYLDRNLEKASEVYLRDLDQETIRLCGRSLPSIINLFCDMSILYCPIVPKDVYLDALDSTLKAETTGTYRQVTQLYPEKAVFAKTAAAMGILLISHHKLLEVSVANMVITSKDLIPEILAQELEISTVQCLAVQAVSSLYHPSGVPTWHLLGLAMTRAISMGLHRQTLDILTAEDNTNPTLVFWTLYLLDRAMAFSMNRPLGVEDEDITLEIPDLNGQHNMSTHKETCEALFIWRVHHARLLSSWYRSPHLDLRVCLASYQFWQETWLEIAQSIDTRGNDAIEDSYNKLLSPLARKEFLQLSCQSLVQMIHIAFTQGIVDSSGLKVKEAVAHNVPKFIEHLKTCVDDFDLALSFLDGYDIFAASIVYVYCQSQPTSNQLRRLGIAQMKTLTKSMEVLQSISERFSAISSFKNVIWGFLAALEQKVEQIQMQQQSPRSLPELSSPMHTLYNEIASCSMLVPRNLVRLMEHCVS